MDCYTISTSRRAIDVQDGAAGSPDQKRSFSKNSLKEEELVKENGKRGLRRRSPAAGVCFADWVRKLISASGR